MIVSHAVLLTGSLDPTGGRLIDLGGLAVNGFFLISGYLIAASRTRTGLMPYLWRRSLRILPAFWVMLLLTGFVFAPLSTLLTGERWTPAAGWSFVAENVWLKMNQYGIPGTLLSVPYPGVWNGAAWTLFFEFAAYLLVGVLLIPRWAHRHGLLVFGAAFAAILALQTLQSHPPYLATGFSFNALRLGFYFMAGTVFYFLRDRLPIDGRLALLSAAAFATLWWFRLDWSWGHLPLGYLLLWAGARLRIPLGRRNDISYGIYIYAFPIQQLTVLLLGTSGGWTLNALAALVFTLPWALASWFWVERPAMLLRRLVPAGVRA